MIDVQNDIDERNLALNAVGISGLTLPISVPLRDGTIYRTTGSFSVSTSLGARQRGTHMSRLSLALHQLVENPLTVATIHEVAQLVGSQLEASRVELSADFLLLLKKRAPVSQLEGYLEYRAGFKTELFGGAFRDQLQVEVPVMLLCPCSKAISKSNAHNQRSKVKIELELGDHIWFEEVVELVESCSSCELYSVLKRPDEKFVTEASYDQPKFVEDVVRDIALALYARKEIDRFTVHCESLESIHNHNAFASYISK